MKTAMILAAGRGERLRPLTEKIPKALCQIRGKPLIEHHVLNLAKAGFTHLVINHAYLGGQIRQHLGRGERFGVNISYSPEPPGGLETGGGIVNARRLLGDEPFLTVNADIYTDFDFSTLEPPIQHDIHVILVPKAPHLGHYGDFGMEGHMLKNTERQYTLAGICYYQPQVFAQCSQGRYSVTSILRQSASQHKVSAVLHNGLWSDIGSLQRLHALNAQLQEGSRHPQ